MFNHKTGIEVKTGQPAGEGKEKNSLGKGACFGALTPLACWETKQELPLAKNLVPSRQSSCFPMSSPSEGWAAPPTLQRGQGIISARVRVKAISF